MTLVLSKENSVTATTHGHKPSFMDPSKLPWTPWVMDGTYFKLMAIDVRSGGFTIFLKVDPGIEAPVHAHIGAVEGVVLEGEFGYDDDRGAVGHYICEHGSAIHQPSSPNGSIMFAVVHGPIVGYNPDGSVAGIVDAKLMLELAKAGNAADHIDARFNV